MNRYELAVVVSNYNKNGNIYETIDAIYNAGFKNVFVEWFNNDYDWKVSQEEQLEYINEKGLNVIFAHLGYKNINDLWIDEETDIVEKYKDDIKACYEHGISMVVMHLTSHSEAPMYSALGLKRIKEIVNYAKELGVKVAFENTKIKGYLEYVLGNIKDDNVGLCFDSGHNHAHFNDDFNFEFFKGRIFAVHMHDNNGTHDEHLLPFDGTINWDYVVNKLKECNYEGPVTLEIHYHRDYVNMSIGEFYIKGYEAGQRIKEMFERK